MASVAIIHAAEDALPARALAEKLRQAKLTVVLEKNAGEEQRNAAKDAKVTVVLWSPRSNGQQALIEDAQFAKGKSKLLHACMQNAAAPDAFKNDKIINLTGWRVEDDFIDGVKSKGRMRPHPDFEDGVRYMRVVQAVADSRARNEWVEI